MKTVIAADPPVNQAPSDLDPARDLPRGFYDFLTPLHRAFTPRQQELAARRRRVLEAAHGGKLPDYLGPSEATTGSWKVSLPGWCQDQRNQMTGPGDDAELVVKMLNSGAPGVMLDLEDSVANAWPNITLGIDNIIAALRGQLTYHDKKRDRDVSINDSKTVIYTRPRGLHLEQAGVIKGERMAAALFDVAMVAYQVDPTRLKHPLSIYIPKSESADEALWWRDLFVHRRYPRLAAGLHQVHGARRVAPARLSSRRVRLQPSRAHHGPEPRSLGLHGEPDRLHVARPSVGSAGPEHHPARRRVLPGGP